jgi:hypothetical protein
MGTIVRFHTFRGSYAERNIGELLEKATRVLTAEEKVVLDQEWVGKDGSKRKLEVGLNRRSEQRRSCQLLYNR